MPVEEAIRTDDVEGVLHRPEQECGRALVLAHGAGSDCHAPLLAAVARAFAAAGWLALRCNLAFRRLRPAGPPFPAMAARDRDGLKRTAAWMRSMGAASIVLGGHSYGGRQSTMLAAEDPGVAEALLLLSYPLHPPRKPAELRTAHWPQLRTPALFVHGTRDPFGSPGEMRDLLPLIPARGVDAGGRRRARPEAARRPCRHAARPGHGTALSSLHWHIPPVNNRRNTGQAACLASVCWRLRQSATRIRPSSSRRSISA